MAGEQVALGYVARDRAASTRVVHPLGLASKGSVWYLVAAHRRRPAHVPRRSHHRRSSRPASRSCGPEGFELAEAWRLIADEVDQRRTPLVAQADGGGRASVPILRLAFGNRVRIGPPVGADRVEVELRGHNVESLAGEIAGFGAAVEVLDPPEVRERLAQLAAELRSLYAPRDAESGHPRCI